MPGKKQFDEEKVIDAAMKTFWQNGFEGTSLSQLEAATGLNKSSLYNAYKSKENIYELCLSRFTKRYGADLVSKLEHPDYEKAIRGFFDTLIDRQLDAEEPKGCYATFAAMELGGKDDEISKSIEQSLDTLRDAFRERCRKAMADGHIARETDCETQSAMLLAMTRGIAVLGRGHSDIKLLRDALEGMLVQIR